MSIVPLTPLNDPAEFSHKVDWALDTFDNSIRPTGSLFRPTNSRYQYEDGFSVSLDTSGRIIKLAFAGPGDVDLNFARNSALLLAVNSDDIDDPFHAAISIGLTPGVRAVGSFVSGFRKGISTQSRQDFFIAEMWVRLNGQTDAIPCAASGINGPTPAPDVQGSAPFVGVKSEDVDIEEVWFDVSLFGGNRFDFVAISDLCLIRV